MRVLLCRVRFVKAQNVSYFILLGNQSIIRIIYSSGPELELFYAEEAIGLAKTLSWDIIKGPFWDKLSPDINYEKMSKDKTKPKEENYTKLMGTREIEEEFNKENIVDGDYVYTPCFQGVYWRGGVIIDPEATSEEEEDLYDEWHDKIRRESFAKNSLVKMKSIAGRAEERSVGKEWLRLCRSRSSP